jgi:hypothetical protein
MLAPFTPLLRDLSTVDGFRFQFACALCGGTWSSGYRSLDPEGFEAPFPVGVRALIWENGHRAALQLAEAEALFHFNHCDRCDRWVCDGCFRPNAWPATGDRCRDCAPTQERS